MAGYACVVPRPSRLDYNPRPISSSPGSIIQTYFDTVNSTRKTDRLCKTANTEQSFLQDRKHAKRIPSGSARPSSGLPPAPPLAHLVSESPFADSVANSSYFGSVWPRSGFGSTTSLAAQPHQMCPVKGTLLRVARGAGSPFTHIEAGTDLWIRRFGSYGEQRG